MGTAQARLFVRKKRYKDGSFQAMNHLKTDLNRQGYPLNDLHVGYARAKGIFYCKNCGVMAKDPDSDFYQNNEYWICECKQINYVKYE